VHTTGVFPQIALHDQMSNGFIHGIYISLDIHWNGIGFRCHLIANSDIIMAWLCLTLEMPTVCPTKKEIYPITFS